MSYENNTTDPLGAVGIIRNKAEELVTKGCLS